MTSTGPLVSIGLPIFNAGDQTRRIIENVLAQEYVNFELIISDNASTDNTWNICLEYAAQDKRIRLFQNDFNMGSLYNFQHVFELATGEYFAWVAHDDSWETTYIEACVRKMEIEPQAVLCYTNQIHIHTDTGIHEQVIYTFDGTQATFGKRVKALLSPRLTPYSIIYGVFRREPIGHAFPIPSSSVPDIHFLIKASRLGTFVHVPQLLLTRTITVKNFRQQMKRVLDRDFILPQPIVYIGFWLRLTVFAWTEGQGIVEKIRIATAVSRYIGYVIIIVAIPNRIRPWVRSLVRRNTTV